MNKYITRWKVSHVHRSDLARRLNKLTADGWEIRDLMCCFGRFSIVAKRRVRVRK